MARLIALLVVAAVAAQAQLGAAIAAPVSPPRMNTSGRPIIISVQGMSQFMIGPEGIVKLTSASDN